MIVHSIWRSGEPFRWSEEKPVAGLVVVHAFKFLAAAPWPSAWMGSGGERNWDSAARGQGSRRVPVRRADRCPSVAIGVPVHQYLGGGFVR